MLLLLPMSLLLLLLLLLQRWLQQLIGRTPWIRLVSLEILEPRRRLYVSLRPLVTLLRSLGWLMRTGLRLLLLRLCVCGC